MSDELILEKAASPALIVDIKNASSFFDIAAVFAEIFDIAADQIPGQSPPKTPTDYKAGNTDFGLQARGVKAREQLNATARDILSRVDSLDDLSEEDIAVLKQYSGRGGTSVNSQFEYYTPTPVASGVWDILKEHGFTTGNVLDPATGAGVFSATKPEGTIVTGTDIDPTGSKIASLLHPEDSISNQSFESLAVKTPDDHFDSVVGNVPFGDARGKSIHDDPAYKDEKRLERYFILRALDKTKAGGLACLVVPTNIVGAKSERWRRFRIALSKKAEFLGAHKLPSKTFGAQGTDTVTDIIVLKKHPRDLLERIEDLPFDTLKETNVVWETFVDGRYWLEDGRPFIQGKWVPKVDGDRWSREVVDGDIDPMAIKTKLAIKFQSRIDWDALESAPANVPSYVDGDQKMINGRQYELTNGQWVPVVETMTTTAIDKALYGVGSMEELKAILASAGGPLQLTFAQMVAVYEAWPDLLMSLHRDAIVFALKQDESIQEQAYRGTIVGGLMGRLSSGAESDYDRPRLQQLVVGEIDRFGHPKNNKDLQFAGSCSRAFGLFVNAVDEKGTFCDLLSGTLNTDHLQFNPSDIQSIVEHLYIREGIHSIELEDVKKLYAGTMKIDSLGDLADVENIAITPAGTIEPLSRYTAGDVYPKIVAMTEAMADEQDDRLKSKWQHQIAIIKSRLHFTKSEDITVGFRDKWLPRSYVLDFLKENGYKNAKYGKWQKVMVEDPVSGNPVERLRFIEDLDAIDGQFKDVENKSGFSKQFEKYLNGGQITSSKQEYIEAYKAEAKALTEAFNAWLQQHTDLDRITRLYNRKFNSFIPLEYEDAPLKIDDLDDEVVLHGYQCQAVRKLSEEGTGFLSDDVGLGKTFSALSLHFYNKQMGRTKKTCISVPDSVLDNWYHEADAITKNMDDCLFVGLEPKLDKDGNIQREAVLDEHGNQKIGRNGQPLTRAVLVRRKSKQDIWEAMWQIPTTSKSLVVMTKENFGKIPMRQETKGKYAEKMAERELISAKIAKSMGAGAQNKERSYQDDKDALRAEAKYSDEGTVKKDEFPYFEDMGFTSVIVDEAHDYKNLYQAGKESSKIAYLPTAPSSQRALDMAMKTAYLREVNDGKGVYPLTATPVSNSPFEIMNMLSYVAPMEEFERFGVFTVDDFVRVFGKIEQVDKVMVSGEVTTKDGLVGFQNLDGLRNLFHKYVLFRDAKDVGLKLPPHDEINQDVELSEEQELTYQDLREQAIEAAKPGKKEDGDPHMFQVIRDMDRVTTDMDLYHHTITFIFKLSDKEKVDKLVAELPKTIEIQVPDEDGRMIKAKQSLTPVLTTKGKVYEMVINEAGEEHVASKMQRLGIEENDVSHPLTPKYAKLVENIRAHLEEGGKQIVFTEEKSQHRKLKRILSHHIPLSREKIAIINADDAAGTKLQKISDQYNAGAVKVVIANKKAEVGVNLQKGTSAIHHLTLPWTPSSIKQRNGRGVRQGNTAANVKVYYYLGKGSFDFYRLDLLNRKSNWINDLLKGRSVEAANGNAMSQDDMLDMLAADPEEAKRRRMERLAKQKAERDARENQRMLNMLEQIANVSETLESLDETKEQRRQDLTSKVEKLTKTIIGLKERGLELKPGDPDRAKLGERLIKEKDNLEKAQKALAGLDEAFSNRKAELENVLKRNQAILQAKAKKGELPFDAELVDNPGSAMSLPNGKLVKVGQVYELIDADDSTSTIFKITEVNRKKKAIGIEGIIGHTYYLPTDYVSGMKGTVIRQERFPNATQVSYSEKELALKKVMSEQIMYSDLPKSGIEKQDFYSNVGQMRISGDCIVHDGTGGGYTLESSYDVEDKSRIVFPEPQNPDYRKHVAEMYLAFIRGGGYASYGLKLVMEMVFGTNWAAAASEYGAKATEAQVREFYTKTINDFLDDKLENGANETDPQKLYSVLRGASVYSLFESGKVRQIGDNVDFIMDIVKQCYDAQYENIYKRAKSAEAQKEREAEMQALAKVKEDPNYKEVPGELAAEFAKMGITVKINTEARYP